MDANDRTTGADDALPLQVVPRSAGAGVPRPGHRGRTLLLVLAAGGLALLAAIWLYRPAPDLAALREHPGFRRIRARIRTLELDAASSVTGA